MSTYAYILAGSPLSPLFVSYFIVEVFTEIIYSSPKFIKQPYKHCFEIYILLIVCLCLD